MIDLFGARRLSTERLRSAYEEQIRNAASQEERHRLARDLHDSIKQQIFAMQTAAATAQARFDDDPPGAKEALDRLRESGREAMTEMEAMLDSLRSAPIENVGLVEAVALAMEPPSRCAFPTPHRRGPTFPTTGDASSSGERRWLS